MVNSMDLPWIFDNRPWFCYIYYEKSMEQPWEQPWLSMYFPWSIDGISSWFFEYGHRKTWVFHGSDHGFPWNNHGFPMSLHVIFYGCSMVFPWVFYGLAPVDCRTLN